MCWTVGSCCCSWHRQTASPSFFWGQPRRCQDGQGRHQRAKAQTGQGEHFSWGQWGQGGTCASDVFSVNPWTPIAPRESLGGPEGATCDTDKESDMEHVECVECCNSFLPLQSCYSVWLELNFRLFVLLLLTSPTLLHPSCCFTFACQAETARCRSLVTLKAHSILNDKLSYMYIDLKIHMFIWMTINELYTSWYIIMNIYHQTHFIS